MQLDLPSAFTLILVLNIIGMLSILITCTNMYDGLPQSLLKSTTPHTIARAHKPRHSLRYVIHCLETSVVVHEVVTH
jgi:hypothetical protein